MRKGHRHRCCRLCELKSKNSFCVLYGIFTSKMIIVKFSRTFGCLRIYLTDEFVYASNNLLTFSHEREKAALIFSLFVYFELDVKQ